MALDGSASCASSARAKRRLAVDLLIRVAISPGHDGAPTGQLLTICSVSESAVVMVGGRGRRHVLPYDVVSR
jgi:hypothetical protein